MTILEKAHELGELIKESPEMKAMNDAEEAQKMIRYQSQLF